MYSKIARVISVHWRGICFILLMIALILNLVVITQTRNYIRSQQRFIPVHVTNRTFPETESPTDAIYADRLRVLKEGCAQTAALNGQANLDYLIENRETLLSNFIYNDEHRVVYCFVAKVSSTQWKKLFSVLEGLIPIERPDLEPDRKGIIHDLDNHPRLSRLSEQEARTRLESYRSFMFVRHPLVRLVSAYKDKFVFGKPPWDMFVRKYGSHIIKRYRELYPSKKANDKITFNKFISWMGSEGTKKPKWRKEEHDPHWEPAHSYCHPCIVNYTVIGHQETLLEDADYVLRLVGITSIKFPGRVMHSTSSNTPRYFARISDDELRRGLARLYSDFILFGYKPEEAFEDVQDKKRVMRVFDELTMEDVYRAPWYNKDMEL